MSIETEIINLESMHMVGSKVMTNFSKDPQQTPSLFQTLMPQKDKIHNRIGDDVYLIKTNSRFFEPSQSEVKYTKLACVNVKKKDDINLSELKDLTHYLLDGGLYVKFTCRGMSSYQNLFTTELNKWLISEKYDIDDRNQFDLLPIGYKPSDPLALEYVYIPIKSK